MRRVHSPDGRSWTIRRRWVPRLGEESLWRRFRRRFGQTVEWTKELAPDTLDVLDDSIVLGIALVLLALLVIFVGLPVLIAILDLVLILSLALIGVLGRVLFRRPWVIEVRDDDRQTTRWRVVGWRASARKLDEIEQVLRIGLPLPTDGT
jgi:di/tricarboxylate transporter